MSSGRIVQIIGAVIDVEFERDSVPQVYDAVSNFERVDSRGPTTVRRWNCSNNSNGYFGWFREGLR